MSFCQPYNCKENLRNGRCPLIKDLCQLQAEGSRLMLFVWSYGIRNVHLFSDLFCWWSLCCWINWLYILQKLENPSALTVHVFCQSWPWKTPVTCDELTVCWCCRNWPWKKLVPVMNWLCLFMLQKLAVEKPCALQWPCLLILQKLAIQKNSCALWWTDCVRWCCRN